MATFEEPEFQELKSQAVREYWQDEARDFTPWLVEEIESDQTSNLEDALGLDLTVKETEKSVGKYSVDVLAEVVADGRKVVIENQLSQSDHDHLGKAIAYAAGLDADIIVWIAPTFNDEHRDAIQWLNQNSREGVDLFAIRLEVWRIGESSPAVRLNPLEDPSEWKEKVQRSKTELTEKQELQEEFWTQFRDRIVATATPLRARKPWHRHYYSNPIGKSGFHLSFVVISTENQMRVVLTIEDDEDAFWKLFENQEAIEADVGKELNWDEPTETRSGNMRSSIGVDRDGDIYDVDRWEEHQDWLMEYGERFHEAFYDRIQRF